MNNLEKLATQSTQDKETQNKNTTQYVLDTTTRKQTQTMQAKHEPSYKQLEVTQLLLRRYNIFTSSYLGK